jgi:DNA-binding winged helix-turn-helix (wHTH) protein
LLYLVERRDRYVSRAELLDLFWEGREVYDDALRKCIGTIRKALNDPSDKPRFIETRWGVGYRYIGPVEEQLVQEGLSRQSIHTPRRSLSRSSSFRKRRQ